MAQNSIAKVVSLVIVKQKVQTSEGESSVGY